MSESREGTMTRVLINLLCSSVVRKGEIVSDNRLSAAAAWIHCLLQQKDLIDCYVLGFKVHMQQ
jgi:hypothetical protein